MSTTVVWVLGLGGQSLDPGGASSFIGRVNKLPVTLSPSKLLANAGAIKKITAPAPFAEESVGNGTSQDVIFYLKSRPADEVLMLVGDSCGANKLPYIADQLKAAKRKVVYMAAVQASYWCQSSWIPGVPDNVGEFLCIYSSWWLTGGLGVYQAQLQPGNKITKPRYVYVNDIHPGDNDVTGVQNPILADIKRLAA